MPRLKTADNTQVYDERNLVVVSRYPIVEHRNHKHDYTPPPRYQKVTAKPPEVDAKNITWERPIMHVKLALDNGSILHVLNLHLKSKLPTRIDGQMIDNYTWRTASGWAEGFFVSAMKRVGQALEVRMLVDTIFDQDEDALIVVCGDFNATSSLSERTGSGFSERIMIK